MTAPDQVLTDLLAADLNSHTWGNEYENAAHEEHTFDGGCKVCRGDTQAIADRVALVVEQHTQTQTAIPEGWELRESAQLEEISRSKQRELEAREATIARWRARAEKTEATVARVEKLRFASDDGSEYEHNPGCGGEPDCPACWAEGITAALEGEQR